MGLSNARADGYGYRFNYGASCYTPSFCTTSYYTPGYRYSAPSYRCYRSAYLGYGYRQCYTPSYGYYGYYGGNACYTPRYGYAYGYSPYVSCYTPSSFYNYGGW